MSLKIIAKASTSTSTPRISVNKLAEYIEASPSKRRAILHKQKYPEGYIVTRYKHAIRAIKSFFEDGDRNSLEQAIADLRNLPTGTEFQQNDIASSIQVLELFLNADVSQFAGCTVKVAEKGQEKLVINGVTISVELDLLVGNKKKDIKQVGGIKLHVIKSSLPENQQKTVALLVKKHVEATASEEYVVKRELCCSFDAFSGRTVLCPISEKRRMEDVEAACLEIAALWDTI